MQTVTGDLRTARQIARQEGVPFHRVDYAIQRLGIAEAARVGIFRLFDSAQVEAIRAELRDIAARRHNLAGKTP